jgi:hypothetical protein
MKNLVIVAILSLGLVACGQEYPQTYAPAPVVVPVYTPAPFFSWGGHTNTVVVVPSRRTRTVYVTPSRRSYNTSMPTRFSSRSRR